MQSGCTSKQQLNNKQMATAKYSRAQFKLQRDPTMKWQGITGEIQFAGQDVMVTLRCANWKLTFGGTESFTADAVRTEEPVAWKKEEISGDHNSPTSFLSLRPAEAPRIGTEHVVPPSSVATTRPACCKSASFCLTATGESHALRPNKTPLIFHKQTNESRPRVFFLRDYCIHRSRLASFHCSWGINPGPKPPVRKGLWC